MKFGHFDFPILNLQGHFIDIENDSPTASPLLTPIFTQIHSFDICSADFKFYDDGADEFRENEGTLLPLWKFSFERAAGCDTTALCWCPGYSDLFAASFGSCELKVS